MSRLFLASGALLIAGLAVAGCGRQVALTPKPGMAPVPTPAFASEPESSDTLMRASTQARPRRNVDILSRSEERQADPFDLPPGPDNGK
jgi:hypothetical protein